MALETGDPAGTRRASEFRARFFSAVLRGAFDYVSARDHEDPYPERLKAQSAIGRGRLVLEGTLANLARRAVHRVAARRRRPWLERAAGELAATAGNLERLELVYDRLGDEPSRDILLKLFEWRILGPRRVELPVSPDAYRKGLDYVHDELLHESATREVHDPYFPALNRYAVTLRGHEVNVETDETCMHDIFVGEQYAYRRGPVDVVAEPGDVVLDGGGGYGDTALYFSSLVAPDGQVVVVEMDPRNREMIEHNLQRNDALASRVRVVDATLWHETGVSLPYVAGGKMSRVDVPDAVEGGTLETTTLDDLVQHVGLQRVDLLKLDVEGAELSVLKGATRILEEHRPKLAVAVYHDPDDLIRIPLFVDGLGLGYRLFIGHNGAGGDETVLFAAV